MTASPGHSPLSLLTGDQLLVPYKADRHYLHSGSCVTWEYRAQQEQKQEEDQKAGFHGAFGFPTSAGQRGLCRCDSGDDGLHLTQGHHPGLSGRRAGGWGKCSHGSP